MWRALRRLGLTRKKKTLHADEQDRPDVQKKRRSFRRKVKRIEPRTAGFRGRDGGDHGDDPGLRLGAARRTSLRLGPRFLGVGDRDRGAWGWTGCGPRWCSRGRPTPRRSSRTSSRCWCRTLHAGDVVVFDNLSAHLGPAVAEAIEGAGASVLPLPPYSPDYTPIEEMFSKVKEFLRRVAARVKGGSLRRHR